MEQRVESFLRTASNYKLSLGRLKLTDQDLKKFDWAKVAHQCKVLDLSGNKLTTLPSSLSELHNLEELILYKNDIVSIPTGLFRTWRNLHTLLISDNCLKALPNDTHKARNLRVIDISCNKFTNIPPQFGLMQSLEYLYATENPLVEEQKKYQQEGTLLDFVRSNPAAAVCSGSFAHIYEQSESTDLDVTFHVKDGRWSKSVHRCLVEREALFAKSTTDGTLEVGAGEFDQWVWEKVLLFLYSGYLSCQSRTEFAEICRLALMYEMTTLKELLAEETNLLEAEDDALVKQAKEEGKKNFVLPEKIFFVDGSAGLAQHMMNLYSERSSGDFFIHCSEDDVKIRVHMCFLESCVPEFFGAILRNACCERLSKTIRLDVESGVVKAVLEWIYTGEVGLLETVDLLQVLQVAEQIQAVDLVTELSLMLADSFEEYREEVPSIFEFLYDESTSCRFELLRSHAISFMRSNLDSMAEFPNYKSLPSNLKDLICNYSC